MPTERPGHPHADSALVRFLGKRVDDLRGVKTQREIAAEAGFARANVLSMIKTGETALPLARLPALARALEADPAHMFRLGMVDLWPDFASLVATIFGKHMASAHEAAIFLEKWRAATGETDPAPNAQVDAAVDAMLVDLFRGP